MAVERDALLCPSAPPDWPDAKLIGVVRGSAVAPSVIPLARAMPVTEHLVALAGTVLPTEVFRFAAPCAESRCKHFRDDSCHLATKLVRLLPRLTSGLPFCTVRSKCRWFHQERQEACLRCSGVVTDDPCRGPEMQHVCDPEFEVPKGALNSVVTQSSAAQLDETHRTVSAAHRIHSQS